MTAARDLTEFI